MFKALSKLGVSALMLSPLWAAGSHALTMAFCSNLNTATSNPNRSIYQSNGLCQQQCVGQFAFAILQGDSCWCSDVAPDASVNVNTNKCTTKCPGFPDDLCGGNNLFSYFALAKNPVSTAGAAPATTSAPSPAPPPAILTTQFHTQTVQETVTLPMPDSLLSTASSNTDSPTPSVSIATVTAGGTVTVKTVTVTPTSGINSANQAQITANNSGGISAGAAAGIVVGAIAAAGIAGAVAFFCFMRRKKRREAEDGLMGIGIAAGGGGGGGSGGRSGGASPGAATSTPSHMTEYSPGGGGLGAAGAGGMAAKDPNRPAGAQARQSWLKPVDPRMDPFGSNIYTQPENKSHDSINTIRDDLDYSRKVHHPKVLRAMNPDPADE